MLSKYNNYNNSGTENSGDKWERKIYLEYTHTSNVNMYSLYLYNLEINNYNSKA